ncbi:MAG: hypothetical protein NTW30_02400 [Candidatus Aenigmarchaeota archaeon]|nr:hypothetical protein [Candidatus Aenigmarchaeota archaeon]
MRDKEQILLEMNVSDVLLGLVHEQVKDDLYNTMTTSDLQGYCQTKAQEIVKLFKMEIMQCKADSDPFSHTYFEDCLKRKGIL